MPGETERAASRGPLLAATGLAAALQAIYLASFLATPLAKTPLLDAALYDGWAQRIAAGELLRDAPFHMAPLYAYALGGLYRLFGRDLAAVAIAQSLLWLANGLLVAALAHRLARGRRFAAPAALLLFALHAPFAFYAVRAETVTLALGAVLLALNFLAARRAYLAGLAAGLALLARPELVLFLPLGAAWLFRERKGDALRFTAAAALAVAPATAHNLVANGRFLLVSSSGGEVFFQGNQPEGAGTIRRLPGASGDPLAQEAESSSTASREAGRRLEPDEVSAHWFRRGLDEIAKAPGAWIGLELRKARLVLSGRDLPLSYSLDVERREATPWLWAFPVSLPLLLGLALLGLSAERDLRLSSLLGLFLAAQAAALLAFFVATRLKLPLTAALVPFAAAGALRIPELVRARSPRLLAAATVGALSMASGLALRPPLADSYNGLGMAYLAQGRAPEAAGFFRRALAGQPDRIAFQMNLASAEEAIPGADPERSILDALSRAPNHAPALNALGVLRLKRGDPSAAAAAFERAAAADPAFAFAWFNLAQARRRLDDVRGALGAVETGLRVSPNADMHALAASLAEGLGERRRTAFHWREAVRLRAEMARHRRRIG